MGDRKTNKMTRITIKKEYERKGVGIRSQVLWSAAMLDRQFCLKVIQSYEVMSPQCVYNSFFTLVYTRTVSRRPVLLFSCLIYLYLSFCELWDHHPSQVFDLI